MVQTTQLPVDYTMLNPRQRKLVRERYVVEQQGMCCCCGSSLSGEPAKEVQEAWVDLRLFPLGFLKYPVHLHHDHETGMTIGAVHSRCNAVLWQYYGS